MTVDEARIEQVRQSFRRIADTARVEEAPLYEALAGRIVDDPYLLAMAAHARPNQSVVYLLFDSVHYMLLSGTQHELVAYYPSITAAPEPPSGAYEVFRAFCEEHHDRLIELIESHNNQTNEVGRVAAILPVISEAAHRGGDKPVALVEVGTSAGLNLIFDHYYFDYGRVQWGDPSSTVRVSCRLGDDTTPPLVAGRPNIASRIGIDIDPVDVTDLDAARWMMSSTWADHTDLASMQRAAVEVLRKDPPRIVTGDALVDLAPLLAEVPVELTLVVYQSFMINQLTEEQRARFIDILATTGKTRPVYFVSMLSDPTMGFRRAHVDLDSWIEGKHESVRLVEGQTHGRSVRWLG